MDWKNELKPLSIIITVFLVAFFLPIGFERFDNSLLEALHLVKWYAEEHVILCLVPAFFIAGAISVFVSQGSVMKYLGKEANKIISYLVASVSGSILAVCSCTILPLFAGIYKRGAGLGPASAFLYSGPAINVLAIILTARILGPELGVARAVGAVLFSIIIGLLMAFIFRKDEEEKSKKTMILPENEDERPIWKTVIYFTMMVLILIFANWGEPDTNEGLWFLLYSSRWILTSIFATILGIILVIWYDFSKIKLAITGISVFLLALFGPSTPLIPFSAGFIGLSWAASTNNEESEEWISSSFGYAKQILPLLFLGVLFAGFLLGRIGHEGAIPSEWISSLVGGNSLFANFFASIVGAFMYFATLTEVPILQGLIDNGMGKGPALALLLAGPALSLPNMLVIRTVIGTKKTVVFVSLVVIMATISGIIFGSLF